MTQNQIAYHNALELKRHNLATEQETARHQSAEEELKRRSNELAEESNRISKEHYERMDAINSRHYSNQDQYNLFSLAEQTRANQASEQLRSQQNAINAAQIAETQRHQLAMESIESRLAGNTIYKTAAEVSNLSENARYTRQRVEESKANIRETGARTTLLNRQAFVEALRPALISSQTRNTQLANTKLQVETVTEAFKSGELATRSISNILNGFGKMGLIPGSN